MKVRIACAVAAIPALLAATAAAQTTGWIRPSAPTAAGQSSVCASFHFISGTVDANSGPTNGMYGVPLVGEVYTVTVTGPGAGSFRIVGDSSGAVTYAGPAAAPGTLAFTVGSAPPPSGAFGVGYFFDSIVGTLTVTASCIGPSAAAPAVGAPGKTTLILLLAIFGGAFAVRRKRIR